MPMAESRASRTCWTRPSGTRAVDLPRGRTMRGREGRVCALDRSTSDICRRDLFLDAAGRRLHSPLVTIPQERLRLCPDRSSRTIALEPPAKSGSTDPGTPMPRELPAHGPQIDADLAVEDQQGLSVNVELLRWKRRETIDVEVSASDPAVRRVVVRELLNP